MSYSALTGKVVHIPSPQTGASLDSQSQQCHQNAQQDNLLVRASESFRRVSENTADKYRSRVMSVLRALGYDTPILMMDESGGMMQIKAWNLGDPQHLCSPQFMDELLRLKENKQWSPGTWQITRNAIAYVLAAEIVARGGQLCDDFGQALQNLFALETPKVRKNRDVKATHSKQKHITQTELRAILAGLVPKRKDSVWPPRASYFMMAGLSTGLRPIEWLTAQWCDESKSHLYVKTAKLKVAALDRYQACAEAQSAGSNNGLAFDSTAQDQMDRVANQSDAVASHRLVPVDAPERAWVEAHFSALDAYLAEGGTFSAYFNACRLALWRTVKELIPTDRQISLYTMRHQFAANSRLHRVADETARVMGNSRRSLSEYSGARVAHPTERRRARGMGGMSESERAAIEHRPLLDLELGQNQTQLGRVGSARKDSG